MINFDPWTASLESAQEHHDEALGPAGAIYQWAAATKLIADKSRIENGDGFDVLQAVADCALHGLVMPDWLARAYLKRYRAVQRLHVASWDEAFGSPYKKGAQIAAMRRRRNNRLAIWKAVTDFRNAHPGEPLDPYWESLGRQVGEGRTNAQKLYSEALRLGLPPASTAGTSVVGRTAAPVKFEKVAGRHKRR